MCLDVVQRHPCSIVKDRDQLADNANGSSYTQTFCAVRSLCRAYNFSPLSRRDKSERPTDDSEGDGRSPNEHLSRIVVF